jgi:class 3 adenylate cyclase/predicted ATPase
MPKPRDIRAWLTSCGLDRYSEVFARNEIDLDVLLDLTELDLKEIGVAALGDRKRLMKAIAEMRQADSSSPIAAAAKGNSTDAGRRQISVLFCDLVGSVELSQKIDPEDLRELMRQYQAACAGIVARFDGFLAKFLGDGILAYFGYPAAHEDDAERAVRAGLAMAEAVATIVSNGRTLSARVGIATGPVVVGDIGGVGEANAAIGETPNLAARLQAEAPHGGVVIAPATRRLLGNLFDYVELGHRALKGIAEPLAVTQVLGERSAESRFLARRGARLTRLVGRDGEMGLFLDRWRAAANKEGQVLLLTGEAGIGKSRMVAAVREAISENDHASIQFQCSPHHADSPLHPAIHHLSFAAGIEAGDPPAIKLLKLERLVAPEFVPPFAALLSIQIDESRPALDQSPQLLKTRILSALASYVMATASQRPTLFIVEDAHWIDPTTREFLDTLIEPVARERMLLVLTARPEFQHRWGAHTHVTMVALSRLDQKHCTELISRIASDREMPEDVKRLIVARSDGVPLFLEELATTVLESGVLREENGRLVLDQPLGDLAVPASLQDSLMARLDRLPTSREVAQVAAAIGREFDYELLSDVTHIQDDELRRALSQLESAGLVFRQGNPPAARYSFKHALLQDAAHSSLLRSRREVLHARIAAALAARGTDDALSQPEVLAQHYNEAGLHEHAARSWLQAARQALAKSAALEAAAQVRRGLASLRRLEKSTDASRLEIELQIALGQAWMAVRGYGSDEAQAAYLEAATLSERFGDTRQSLRVLVGLRNIHQLRGELSKALEIVEKCLRIAREDDHSFVQHAYVGLAHTLCYLGRFTESRRNAAAAIELYDIAQRAGYLEVFGLDPKVLGLAVMAWCEWSLGYPDRSLDRVHGAIELGKQLGHPQSLEHALTSAASIHVMRCEPSKARAYIEAALAISERHGFRMRSAMATMMQGWTWSMSGDVERGAARLAEGLAAYTALGARAGRSSYLPLLAGALRMARRAEDALNALAEAERETVETGECWWKAEIGRLTAELRSDLGLDDAAETERRFRTALGVARHQGARSWELRSSLSLARLLRDQGRRDEAVSLLRPIIASFTEGRDTPDLLAAEEFLADLG